MRQYTAPESEGFFNVLCFFFLRTIYSMLAFKVALLHVPVLSNCAFYCTFLKAFFVLRGVVGKKMYRVWSKPFIRPDVESSYSTSKLTFMH